MPKVPKIEIGTATAGISVARTLPRNTNTTAVTSNTEITSVFSVSFSEARIVVVRSDALVMVMSCGMAASIGGSAARTPSTVSMMLAAGLAEDDDQHRGLAVRQALVAQILDRVLHVGDVGQPHRGAVTVGHHQRDVVGGVAGLVVGVQLVVLVAVLDRPLRAVGVGRRQRGADVLEADAVFE